MSKLQIPTTASNVSRKALSILLVALATASFLGAGVAQADRKQGSGGAAGCQVENNGKVETVPVGTKVGLFTCGEDGEWHFGWLINAISSRPKSVSGGTGTGTGTPTASARSGAASFTSRAQQAEAREHASDGGGRDTARASRIARRRSARRRLRAATAGLSTGRPPLRLTAWRTTSSSADSSAAT